jgi:hypothetical protein
LYRENWKGSHGLFACVYRLNENHFSRWLQGKRQDPASEEAVMKWLAEPNREANIRKTYGLRDLMGIIGGKGFGKILFIDGDQCALQLSQMGWILGGEERGVVESSPLLVIVVTAQGLHLPKQLPVLPWLFHIESQSKERNAADFTICSLINQTWIYYYYYYYYFQTSIPKLAIATNDHFARAVRADFLTLSVDIFILDPMLCRLDLFLLSELDPRLLSRDALGIRYALSTNNYATLDRQYYPTMPPCISDQALREEAARVNPRKK